jgi:hypothetical protein
MTEAGTYASPRCRFDSIRFDSIRFDSIRFDSHDGLVLDEVVFLTLRGGQTENR